MLSMASVTTSMDRAGELSECCDDQSYIERGEEVWSLPWSHSRADSGSDTGTSHPGPAPSLRHQVNLGHPRN